MENVLENGKDFIDNNICICMAVNLSEILESTKIFRKKKKEKIGKKWLGKFEDTETDTDESIQKNVFETFEDSINFYYLGITYCGYEKLFIS